MGPLPALLLLLALPIHAMGDDEAAVAEPVSPAPTLPDPPLAGPAPAPSAPPVPPVERWLDSVVLLVTGPAWCAGVVIDEEGLVATAYHCVASGRRPQVRTRAGERYEGRVRSHAPRDDLALVSVPDLAGRVPPLALRAAAPVRGEGVWALGHPFAPQEEVSPLLRGTLVWSASHGVVSAVGERLIQVDAALNPGNSGGPVVDENGAVVGISSRRLSADNVAFISPAARLCALRDGPPRRGLGGTWGIGIAALQGLAIEDAPGVGLQAEVGLRDRALLRAGLYLPVGQRWTAIGLGEARWVNAEVGGAARARLGRGRWSTALDLGASALLVQGIAGRVEDGAVDLWAQPATLRPALVGGLGLGGSALRLLAAPGEDRVDLFLGVDLGFPGTLGTF